MKEVIWVVIVLVNTELVALYNLGKNKKEAELIASKDLKNFFKSKKLDVQKNWPKQWYVTKIPDREILKQAKDKTIIWNTKMEITEIIEHD